jgi:hypothetical protein
MYSKQFGNSRHHINKIGGRNKRLNIKKSGIVLSPDGKIYMDNIRDMLGRQSFERRLRDINSDG